MTAEIPEEVVKKIRRFIQDRATGSVTLHMNDGNINACELKEHFKVKRSAEERLTTHRE